MTWVGYSPFCNVQNHPLSPLRKATFLLLKCSFSLLVSMLLKDCQQRLYSIGGKFSTPRSVICPGQETWAHLQQVGACYNLFTHLELQFSLTTVFFFFLVSRLLSLAKKEEVKFCFLTVVPECRASRYLVCHSWVVGTSLPNNSDSQTSLGYLLKRQILQRIPLSEARSNAVLVRVTLAAKTNNPKILKLLRHNRVFFLILRKLKYWCPWSASGPL